MRRKLISILICSLFIVSVFSSFSFSQKSKEPIIDDSSFCSNEYKLQISGSNIVRTIDAKNIFVGDKPQRVLNLLPPTVEITSPADGTEITDQYISVEGYAYDETGLELYQWLWEWTDGSQSGTESVDPPSGYVEFQIDIGPLAAGENTITVTFYNVEGVESSDSVTIYYISEDNDPPEVVITYPEDGTEFEEPEIYVEGWADDHGGSGIVKLIWTHIWSTGEETNYEELDEPYDKITFAIPINLHEGENTIEVNAEDKMGNKESEPPMVHVYYHQKEGLLFECLFQPVQTVYPDDPHYGNDLKPWIDPCLWNCSLDMVAGKNTFIFGYPYKDRNQIKIKVHNNYNQKKTFSFVFKIYPDNKIIWTSDPVTINPREKRTFTYAAPIPNNPFQWKYWGDNPKSKDGELVLYLSPDPPVKPPADYKCEVVSERMDIKYTHDIYVLFIPFTFKDGPAFPADFNLKNRPTGFDNYLKNDLVPWWNAIYPLKESGVVTDWRVNLKKNISIMRNNKKVWIHDLASFQALNDTEKLMVQTQLFNIAVLSSMYINYDRVVFMLPPQVVYARGGLSDGLAIRSGPNGHYKHGVLVNWNMRDCTPAHEIGHTYGLFDNYDWSHNYWGDPGIGYWVNQKIDVLENQATTRDLMGYTNQIFSGANETWIKKPNFKSLLQRFNEHRDPEVLMISGFIDKNDNIELNPWYKIDEGFIDIEWGTTGEYLVKAYDGDGSLLNTAGFNVNFVLSQDYIGDLSVDETIFAFRIEYIDDMNRIDIVKKSTGEVLASRTVSSNLPQVKITKPSNGEQIKPKTYEIKWEGTDPDGDDLVYNVFISNDSGMHWFPVDLDLHESSCTADLSDLEEDTYLLRVVSTDNWNVGDDIISFSIKKGRNRGVVHDALFLKYFLKWFPFMQYLFQRVLRI